MSYRVNELVKLRIRFSYIGSPVLGLQSSFTLYAYNPAGTLIGSGNVSSVEIANGFYDVSIAAAAVLTAGVYSVAVFSSSDPATLDSAWAYGQTEVDLGCIAVFTVSTGSSTTSIVTSAFSPAGAVADQFKDRWVTFDRATTTAGLRGVSKAITASTNAATPTLTVNTLPATPATGDTGVVT